MKKDYYTKKRIADALKELQHKKPLDKISVGEIARAADVNRSTFYYYFSDKYRLVEWIIEEDISGKFHVVAPEQWMGNVLILLQVIQRDLPFYRQAIGMDSSLNLRRFFREITASTVSQYIENHLGAGRMQEETKTFLVDFVTAGFVETYIRYIETGAEEAPERLLLRYYDLIEPQLRLAIDKSVMRDKMN